MPPPVRRSAPKSLPGIAEGDARAGEDGGMSVVEREQQHPSTRESPLAGHQTRSAAGLPRKVRKQIQFHYAGLEQPHDSEGRALRIP